MARYDMYRAGDNTVSGETRAVRFCLGEAQSTVLQWLEMALAGRLADIAVKMLLPVGLGCQH